MTKSTLISAAAGLWHWEYSLAGTKKVTNEIDATYWRVRGKSRKFTPGKPNFKYKSDAKCTKFDSFVKFPQRICPLPLQKTSVVMVSIPHSRAEIRGGYLFVQKPFRPKSCIYAKNEGWPRESRAHTAGRLDSEHLLSFSSKKSTTEVKYSEKYRRQIDLWRSPLWTLFLCFFRTQAPQAVLSTLLGLI